MWSKNPLLLLLLLLLPLALLFLSATPVDAHDRPNCNASAATSGGEGPVRKKLFVFGDSYADTGNLPKILSPAWGQPYGMTFPRKPYGRFSDGRVLTDFVASFLRLKSPVPHKFRKVAKKLLPYGMNFAIGGTGVFDGLLGSNNLSTQIDTFAKQINEGTYSDVDLGSSTALVSVAGNDYMFYEASGGTMQGMRSFIPQVVNQLRLDLKRLVDMGVPRVAVTNLHPIGCTPYILGQSVSHGECNETVNQAVAYHNDLLDCAVKELNGNSTGSNAVVVIDLFDAFMYVIKQEGKKKFPDIFQQCCMALSSDTRCGYVDSNGTKGYTLCQHPESSFYWDSVHPTQAGWTAVFSWLRSSLTFLLN